MILSHTSTWQKPVDPIFGGLIESMHLCIGGGSPHARLFRWRPGECRISLVAAKASQTMVLSVPNYES